MNKHEFCPDEDNRCQHGEDENCPKLNAAAPQVRLGISSLAWEPESQIGNAQAAPAAALAPRTEPSDADWQPVEIYPRVPEKAISVLYHGHNSPTACVACEIVELRAELFAYDAKIKRLRKEREPAAAPAALYGPPRQDYPGGPIYEPGLAVGAPVAVHAPEPVGGAPRTTELDHELSKRNEPWQSAYHQMWKCSCQLECELTQAEAKLREAEKDKRRFILYFSRRGMGNEMRLADGPLSLNEWRKIIDALAAQEEKEKP